jgi:hypothetical protein
LGLEEWVERILLILIGRERGCVNKGVEGARERMEGYVQRALTNCMKGWKER